MIPGAGPQPLWACLLVRQVPLSAPVAEAVGAARD